MKTSPSYLGLLAALSLLLGALHVTHTEAHGSPLQFGAYWGQDKARGLYPYDSNFAEYELADFCANTPYQVVRLAYVRDFVSVGGMPGIDFSIHCTFPTNAASIAVGQHPTSGFALLSCPAIGNGITQCQNRGKRVILVMSPIPSLFGNQTSNAAINVWNLFLGGQSNLRPFGSAVLDGVELAVRNSDSTPWPAFLQSLRSLMNTGNKRYTITISPRCMFPDANMGPTYPNTVLSMASADINALVDEINVFFTSSPSCTYGNPAGFYNTLQQWSQYLLSANLTANFTITVPGFGYGEEPFVEAMTGDFIPIKDFLVNNVLQQMVTAGGSPFSGINLFDGSFDKWNFPCVGPNPSVPYASLDVQTQARVNALSVTDNRTYAQLIMRAMVNDPVAEGCNYRTNVPGSATSTSASSPPASRTSAPGVNNILTQANVNSTAAHPHNAGSAALSLVELNDTPPTLPVAERCSPPANLSSSERCHYVQRECADMLDSFINYTEVYYCSVPAALQFIPGVLLVVWLMLLFIFAGTAASEFFCPTLSTLAGYWKMSESLAGVTLLAVGNGSPDLFSTFSAFSAGAGGLAIGELVGAAAFITTMVIGSVAFFAPFTLPRTLFLRDILFFAGAVLNITVVVWDRRITFEESASLIIYYVMYVAFVAIGDWITRRQVRKKELEAAANGSDNGEDSDDDDDEDDSPTTNQPLVIRIDDEVSPLLLDRRPSRIPSLSRRIPRLHLDIEEDRLSDAIAPSMMSSTFVQKSRFSYKMSLIDAVDMYDHYQQPPLTSAAPITPGMSLSMYENNFPRRRLQSRLRTASPTAGGLLSPRTPMFPPHLTISTPTGGGWEPGAPSTLATPLSTQPSPHPLSVSVHLPSPPTLAPETESRSLRPPPILTQQLLLGGDQLVSSPTAETIPTEPQTSLVQLLFPLTYVWKNKAFLERLTALVVTPIYVLLRLTVPLVDMDTDDNDGTSSAMPAAGRAPASADQQLLQRLFYVQTFIGTLLVSCTLSGWVGLYDAWSWPALAALYILSALTVTWITVWRVSRRAEARNSIVYVWMGFLVGIVWIYVIANEVVGVLRTLGTVLGISDSILGLTIFAIGNSLGDFIANVTMAKMGFPTMAVAASYASPMLNLVLGVGVSTTWISLKNGGHPIALEVSSSILIAIVGLLCVLAVCLIVFPLLHFHIGATVSKLLMFCYVAVIATAITHELVFGLE
ncbi:hypothetical protein RI367_002065 [Sorochytrium milnesiophthora]